MGVGLQGRNQIREIARGESRDSNYVYGSMMVDKIWVMESTNSNNQNIVENKRIQQNYSKRLSNVERLNVCHSFNGGKEKLWLRISIFK